MIVAYMRVSTNKETQKHDRQEKAIRDFAQLNNFKVDRWFQDTVSGKVNTDNRPKYQIMKQLLKPSDILIISDLDRLGRDADNTIAEIKNLQSRTIKLIALDVPYMNEWHRMNDDSLSKMIIDIVVTLKAHMAEQEHEKTLTRIHQGLAAARQKGVKLGRPHANIPSDFIKHYKKFLNGDYGQLSHAGFAKMMGIGRSTLYKYIKLYEPD